MGLWEEFNKLLFVISMLIDSMMGQLFS
jgi:hypothetical protein